MEQVGLTRKAMLLLVLGRILPKASWPVEGYRRSGADNYPEFGR